MRNQRDIKARLHDAFLLADDGIALTKLRLRRKYPMDSDAEHAERVTRWLQGDVNKWAAPELRVIPGPGRLSRHPLK